MGDRSKYHDSKMVEGRAPRDPEILDTPTHNVALSGARRYDPGTGKMSMLTEQSVGDQFYTPGRHYANDRGWIWSPEDMNEQFTDGYIQPPWRTAELEAQMPTFKGVPPSPAEQFRGQVFARA